MAGEQAEFQAMLQVQPIFLVDEPESMREAAGKL